MIEIKNMSFRYAGQKSLVFDHFSLRMEESKIYGLLGKNGTGKSTLLYLVAGLLRPTAGYVCCDKAATYRRKAETLREIFLVPEEFELPAMTLKRFVELNAPFYPRFSQERLEACLRDFELETELQLQSLSMGQKKKVFMSFAFATNTRVLIMDEPTNGLDIPSKSQFRKLVTTGMTDDKLMLISTHQVRDISDILDHVTIIDQSRVLLNAGFADIMSKVAFRPLQEGDQPLFVLQSPFGPLGAVRAQEGEETKVDLEMLFNAALQNPEAINQLFTTQK